MFVVVTLVVFFVQVTFGANDVQDDGGGPILAFLIRVVVSLVAAYAFLFFWDEFRGKSPN